MYPFAKYLHVSAVVLSFALFQLRGFWMLRGSAQLERRWVRIVPHVVDAVLLAGGLWLAALLQQYPFVHGWLTAKVFGIIAYIVLGSIALRYGRTRRLRAAAYVAATAVFVYILAVARSRHPWPPAVWF